MDDVYIYYVDLPDGIDEAVLPCVGGYTVYIDSRLSSVEQERAYKHALWHIENNDFEKEDLQEIEYKARSQERKERNEKDYNSCDRLVSPDPSQCQGG